MRYRIKSLFSILEKKRPIDIHKVKSMGRIG